MRRVATVALVAAVFLATAQVPVGAGTSPTFDGTIERIPADLRLWMIGLSWHRGCPVPIESLRLLHVDYWGFDGGEHRGRLIVHWRQARPVLHVFHVLFNHRFSIKRILLPEKYGANDHHLMVHNVTSAFNCRWRAGQPGVWSEHAYGRAIDINPVQNPYVVGDHVSPPRGRAYLDRAQDLIGMIHARDVVIRAFARIGWEWGGNWTSLKDYQHLSSTGR